MDIMHYAYYILIYSANNSFFVIVICQVIAKWCHQLPNMVFFFLDRKKVLSRVKVFFFSLCALCMRVLLDPLIIG